MWTSRREELLSNLPPEMVAESCAFTFEAFARTVLPDSFYEPLSPFHQFLTGVVESDQLTNRRIVAGGPRGWGKSTTITEGGPLWIVCRNKYIPIDKRYKFILIVSDTSGQAEDRLFTIKTVLKENDGIATYYPEAAGEGPIWRRDMIVTRNDICIAAKGITSSVRGTRYKNRRPDLIILDDPDNMESVGSPTISADIEERFVRDFLKCGHKYTDVLVVGTVLGKQALCYKLMNAPKFAAWDGKIFKALAKFPANMDLWEAFGEVIKDRANANRIDDAIAFFYEHEEEMLAGAVSNWPEVYSVLDLMKEYYLEGRRSFLLEKQNQIIEDEDAYFKPEAYRYASETEVQTILKYNPLIYIYVDPTGGKHLTKAARRRVGDSDRFSIAVIAKLDNKRFYLVDNIYGQYRQSQQFEKIKNVIEKWDNISRIFRVTVEDRGDEFYITPLREYLKKQGIKRPVPRIVTNMVPKEERIAMLEPYLDNWTITLPEEKRKFRGFYDELEDWPNSSFDDILDSFSGCFFSAYKTHRLRYLCAR